MFQRMFGRNNKTESKSNFTVDETENDEDGNNKKLIIM